jgi:hypothetical protein
MNSSGMRPTCGIEATTPLGLTGLCVVAPGLLASSQPRALSRNPFGIPEASYVNSARSGFS